MQVARQIGSGIFYGLVSVLLVVGGLSLALAESYTSPSPTSTASPPIVPQTSTSTQAGPTALPSSTPSPTTTPLPPTNCPPPTGWILISVQPYDTLQVSRHVLKSLLINWRKPIVYRRTISNPAITFMFLCHQPLSLFHTVHRSGGHAPTLSSREIRPITSPLCTA